MSDVFEDLKKLKEMRDSGEVTQQEYELVKAELMAEIEKRSTTTEKRAPGWYNDPSGAQKHQAYWDGDKWTGATRSRPEQTPAAETAKKPIYRRGWFIVLAVIFGVGAIGSALDQGDPSDSPLGADPPQTTAASEPDTTRATVASPPQIPGTLGITPAQFRSNWNAFAAEADLPSLQIASIDVDSGEVQDVFTVFLSDQLSILGTVNKADGTIRDVQVWGAPSNDVSEAADLILSWGALIAAVDPSLVPEGRGQILEDLGIVGGDEWIQAGYEAEVIRNGIAYSFNNFMEGLGVLSLNAGDPSDSGFAP